MTSSELINKALIALLDKADKQPSKTVRLSTKEKLMRPYINNDPIGLAATLNKEFQRLEDLGLILIKWKNPGILIQYIEMIDADGLAQKLSYSRLESRLEQAIKLIRIALPNSHSLDLMEEQIIQRWQQTGSYDGFSVDKPDVLIMAIKAADHLIQQQDDCEIDERHFSSKVFADSKQLKAIRGKVAKIIKLTHPDIPDELSAQEVLQLFGVVPIRHPIFLTGRVSIKARNGKEVSADFPPCIGVWSDEVISILSDSVIDTITTIENQATFLRYIEREKSENEVVLYTAGIPSPTLRHFFQMLVDSTSKATVRHWGDIDVGGFAILNILEKTIGRPVIAFRMAVDDYAGIAEYDVMTASERERLLKLSLHLSLVNQDTAATAANTGLKYEQESFDS